jgi:hypothetical protein
MADGRGRERWEEGMEILMGMGDGMTVLNPGNLVWIEVEILHSTLPSDQCNGAVGALVRSACTKFSSSVAA